MPSPPGSHPSRQLTVRLPWHVWRRLEALAAADPHGARPGRVAATALDRGVEVLERAAARRGGPAVASDAPSGPLAPAVTRPVARALRGAGLDAKARAGVVTVTAPGWQPPPGDPRWAIDGVGKPYAREAYIVAAERDGGRVEVPVCTGDTVAVVQQALAAAWQARGGLAGEREA